MTKQQAKEMVNNLILEDAKVGVFYSNKKMEELIKEYQGYEYPNTSNLYGLEGNSDIPF